METTQENMNDSEFVDNKQIEQSEENEDYEEAEEEEDDTPSISIKIQNVVSTVNLGCRVELVILNSLLLLMNFSHSHFKIILN